MKYFSGMRPTGKLHLGHYFGVIANWIELQKENNGLLMVADLHALTTIESTKSIKEDSLNIATDWLACGIDPKKNIIFVQSQIPYHPFLAWFLACLTPVSMAELNPAYKEVLAEKPKNNNLGLLTYPVLQAADVLLYKSDVVPVGKDQAPHIEITREIARKFNARYGETFKEPKTLLTKESKIYSFADASKKMSKSHGEKNYVAIFDEPDDIRKKIKSAVTDSGTDIVFDLEKKPAVSNLLTIFNLATGKDIKDLEKEFVGKQYSEFKGALAEAMVEFLRPMREKRKELEKNQDYVLSVLADGQKIAQEVAEKTIAEVKERIGLL